MTQERLERVLAGLGLSERPSADRAGLDRLYGAWCQRVPFDNTRKLLALRSGDLGPLPGIDPADFLDAWLACGAGGTCWPSCNALHAVLSACGFDAARVTASMLEVGVPNHGTIIVRLEGGDYLVDSSMLLNRGVRLESDRTVVMDDPLKPVEYETVNGAVRLWFEFLRVDGIGSISCRLMTRGVSDTVFREACEAARGVGPFNDQLVAARNFPDRVVAVHGRWEMNRHRDGRVTITEHTAAGLRGVLVDTLRFSAAYVDAWADSGALAGSLEDRPRHDGPPASLWPRRPGRGHRAGHDV